MAEYKYVLYNDQLGTYEIKRAPEGWDDFNFTFKRSKEYHGVTIEYSVDLDFVSDGRDFIQAVYNAYGVEGFIRVTVYERDTNAEKWVEAYTGRLNLTRLKLSSLAATANIEQSGVIQKFLNLDEVNINVLATESIAGVSLATPPAPFINVPLHSQAIVKKYEAWATGTAGIQRSPVVDEPGHRSATIAFGFDDIKINEFNAFTYGTGFSFDDEVFPHIVTVEKGEFKIDLGLSTTIKAFRRWDGNQGSGDFDKASLGIYYRINDDAPVRIWYNIDETAQGTYENLVNVQHSFTADLEIGDQIYFYGVIDVWDVSGSYEFMYEMELYAGSFIRVTGNTQTAPTLCRGLLAYEFFAKLAAAITDQADAFYSTFLGRTDSWPRTYEQDGEGSLRLNTNGFNIRNFPITEKPIYSTVKDAYNSYSAIDNLGLGFEQKDGKTVLVIEKLKHFYQNEIGLELGVVTDLKKRPAVEYMYNTAEFGYSKWETESYGGLDETNAKREWLLPLTQIKNKFSAISKFNTGSYLIERIRRQQYVDTTTKDDGSDNENFIICLLRKAGGFETERNQVINISGVASPETTYNARITPARMFKAHEHKLRSSLLKQSGKRINFNFGTGNNKTVTRKPGEMDGLPEDRSPLVKDLAAPIWGDEIYEFTHPITADQLRILRQNPLKKIRFQDENYNYKSGWIIDVKASKEDKEADFTILQAWTPPAVEVAQELPPLES